MAEGGQQITYLGPTAPGYPSPVDIRVAELEARVVELEAVIQKVREARQWHPHANKWFYPPNEIDNALSAAPSVVLADHDAAVWDQGAEAMEDYWRDGRIGRPYPVNPYRGDNR